MLGLRRQTRMDKAKRMLQETASYADTRMHDRRLRSNVRSAVEHSSAAAERVRRDIAAGEITSRLAHDRRLRRNLRALLDDLDGVRERAQRKRHHRVRNALLLASGTGVVLAAIPTTRHWIADHTRVSEDGEALELAV
jgi:hypothetical protein